MAGGTQTRKRAAHLGPERRRPERSISQETVTPADSGARARLEAAFARQERRGLMLAAGAVNPVGDETQRISEDQALETIQMGIAAGLDVNESMLTGE